MKKNVVWNILFGFILALQLAAETLTAAIILRLNILPAKFTVLLIAVFVLLGALTGVLLFVRFRKKPVSTLRRIIACLLALLVVCGCALISKVAADAYRTMNAVTQVTDPTDIHNLYVIVRVDDPAQGLSDTAGYEYACVENYDQEYMQKMLGLIEEQTGDTVSLRQYMTIVQVAEGLLTEETDAVILNGASVALLLEEEKYEDFMEKTRVLFAISRAELKDNGETEPTTEPVVEKDVTKNPFVVYISGSDTRSQYLAVSRSDVNILAVVNPVTKQVLLLNTPRDYFVPNPAGNGTLDKLTHCGNFGVDCSKEALSDLYDLEIDYYAQINFSGLETLVDAVGGITIYSDQEFMARNTRIYKGENHLDGTGALDYCRERYHVYGGDNGRGKNQMKVIKAMIDKVTSGTTIISNYADILKSLEGMFKTSVSMEDISAIVKMQLGDMAKWDVQSFAVTGTGGYEVTYSWPGEELYVMYPDQEMVEYANKLAQRVLDGEILTEADMTVPKD